MSTMGIKKKRTFLVTIEVDEEEVKQKYPNYRLNHDSTEGFIKSVANDLRFVAGVNMSTDGMAQWGFSIKVMHVG